MWAGVACVIAVLVASCVACVGAPPLAALAMARPSSVASMLDVPMQTTLDAIAANSMPAPTQAP